ncbi:MAG: hypothetical protein ACI9CU_002155, partial [Polaribacter sp.]
MFVDGNQELVLMQHPVTKSVIMSHVFEIKLAGYGVS